MKKIGIIGAMDVEVERLKADMTVTRQITKAQMHFCEGTLKNQPVVVVRSGIGKVNAAVCTQILVDEGVKKSDILQEKEASYTYQNALFTKDLLKTKGLHLKKVILSCQAYHARRCLMYYQFVFPEIEFIVSPVITRGVSKENWYQSEYGICLVLKEVEHCGSQFADMMLRPCLCPINVGRDDKDCMQSVTEI